MKPLFLVCVILLLSCSLKKEKQQRAMGVPEVASKKKIKIRLAGELGFRRTFADIQFIENEKERDEYVARREKSNPQLMFSSNNDSSLLDRLEKLDIVKDEEFLERQFQYDTSSSFQIIDSIGKKIKIQIIPFLGDHFHKKIIATYDQDSTEATVSTGSIAPGIIYAVMDVIPGGNKEIVILDEYYIMNGYNFYLKVYEVKN